MAKVNAFCETTNAYGEWLDRYPWTHFATFTTGYEMTLPSARRLMESFHQKLKLAGPTPFFWAAERFEVKDGYHTHGLISVPPAWRYQHLIRIWQKVTGGKKKGKWHRIDLQLYDRRRGARFYVGKYVTKSAADYDFLFN